MLVFKYQKEKTNGLFGKTVARPVATIALLAKNGEWISLSTYIDSGADSTLIPLSTGKLLGLTYKENEIVKIGGVGGLMKAVKKRVRVKIGSKEFPLSLTWALTENVPALLGRKDVFDKFKITFNEKKQEITFEEN